MSRRRLAEQPGEAHLWRVETLGGLELLSACYSEFAYSPHTHDEFLIAMTEDGAALPRYRGGPHLHGPGNVLVLNPGEVHGGGPARGAIWRYRAFYVPTILMRRIWRELTGTDRGFPAFDEDVVGDAPVAAMLRRAHVALERQNSELERESCLLGALAALVRQHAMGQVSAQRIGFEPQAVRRAREYLEALPGVNVSLETLAREAGLSPFHLCRVFHQATGLSPHAYQGLIRARIAKSLLAQGVPIPQAAAQAGFYDQAHLTRHFKRVFGVTPGHYLGTEPQKEA